MIYHLSVHKLKGKLNFRVRSPLKNYFAMSNNAHSVVLEIANVHPQINEAALAELSFHTGHQATIEWEEFPAAMSYCWT